MNEEEKMAKLELNRFIYGKQLSKDDIVDYLSILFNLIDNQQKEIEKYEQQIDLEFVEKNFLEKNKVVSKDKIKDKIKTLEKEIETNNIYEENWNKIDILKELLEEN